MWTRSHGLPQPQIYPPAILNPSHDTTHIHPLHQGGGEAQGEFIYVFNN